MHIHCFTDTLSDAFSFVIRLLSNIPLIPVTGRHNVSTGRSRVGMSCEYETKITKEEYAQKGFFIAMILVGHGRSLG